MPKSWFLRDEHVSIPAKKGYTEEHLAPQHVWYLAARTSHRSLIILERPQCEPPSLRGCASPFAARRFCELMPYSLTIYFSKNSRAILPEELIPASAEHAWTALPQAASRQMGRDNVELLTAA
jgi:hypothetical protein